MVKRGGVTYTALPMNEPAGDIQMKMKVHAATPDAGFITREEVAAIQSVKKAAGLQVAAEVMPRAARPWAVAPGFAVTSSAALPARLAPPPFLAEIQFPSFASPVGPASAATSAPASSTAFSLPQPMLPVSHTPLPRVAEKALSSGSLFDMFDQNGKLSREEFTRAFLSGELTGAV